jgi:tRNA pseudouridine55 synthase
VVQQMRQLTGLRRIGHAGTLDPLATGVLVLCLGQATRLVEYLVDQPKTYVTTVRLGQATTTYDAEGEVTVDKPVTVTRADVETQLSHFRGQIEQIPPMYSAIKRDGVPLYKLARQGVTVDLAARQVTIYDLALMTFDLPNLTLRISCGAGTYVRSLAHDLGQQLGCGAHVTSLRRTAVGRFTDDMATKLSALTRENVWGYVQQADRAVQHLPPLALSSEEVDHVRYGRQIARRPGDPSADLVCATDRAGDLVGVLIAQGDMWQPKKVLI